MTADETTIGSQYDNRTAQFVFTRPEEYNEDDLILLFQSENEGFAPVNIGLSNTFAICNALTQTRLLRLQIAFERDGEILTHSNILMFELRPSLSGSAPVEAWPAPMTKIASQAFCAAAYDAGLLSFYSVSGTQVQQMDISEIVHTHNTDPDAHSAEISMKADKDGSLQTNLNAELHNGWKLFEGVTQLGLSDSDDLSMAQICRAMPDKSQLIHNKTSATSYTHYPASTGLLVVTRWNSSRIEFGFSENSNAYYQKWMGYSTDAISFSGWKAIVFTDSGTLEGAESARILLHHQQALGRLIYEAGTVTLNNTLAYPFNNSVETVAFVTKRDTADYSIDVEVISANGCAGNIIVSGKLVNGFKIAFTGGAESIVVRYVVRGGIY